MLVVTPTGLRVRHMSAAAALSWTKQAMPEGVTGLNLRGIAAGDTVRLGRQEVRRTRTPR